MEFLLITDAKLKIVLDAEDMKKYKLEASTEQGTTARKALWRVLDIAKEEVGFDPAGDKVLVQFYPVKAGGCEVFVTKLGVLPPSSAKLVSRSERVSMLSRSKTFYSFTAFDDVVGAARAVKRIVGNNAVGSELYETDNGIYILTVEEYGKGGELTEFPCIREFGRSLTADIAAYIPEHCRLIRSENAVDYLSSL